jgi:hypothetical protein
MSVFLDEFEQAPGLCYLNHAAIAPWPRRATDAVARFARDNLQRGASDYPAWLATERRLRDAWRACSMRRPQATSPCWATPRKPCHWLPSASTGNAATR